MKKLLSILTAMSLTATVIPSTFGYLKNESILKTDLKEKLTKLTVFGNEANNPIDVLMKIIEINAGSGVDWKDIIIKEFHSANAETDGSAKIFALPNSEFTGEVTIRIIQLGQQDIKNLLEGWTDLGFVLNEAVAQAKAEEVLNLLELKDKVILGQPNNGQIHVVANNPNLKGETDFTYQIQKDLGQIITNKVVDGNEANTAETVLAKIIELNPETGISFDNVVLAEFIPADLTRDGSAILEPTSSEFIGSATVVITQLINDNDEQEVVDQINQISLMRQEEKGVTLEEVISYYNSEYFKGSLKGVAPKFKGELYQATKINRILLDGSEVPLTQEDLDQYFIFDFYLYYNYGKISDQKIFGEFFWL